MTNPAGTPAEGAYEQATFTVGGLPQYDNGTATVEIGWEHDTPTTTPVTPLIDWDVDIFDSRGRPVASAATLDNPERATLIDPPHGAEAPHLLDRSRGVRSPPRAPTPDSRKRGTSPAASATAR